MRHRLFAHVLTVCLFLAGTATAQPPKPPADDQQPAATNDGNYVIEQKHLLTRFEKDGTGRRQLKMRVKLLREPGVRQWGQLPFAYAPETEELTLERVQVEKADGTITADATGAVQDLAVRPAGDLPVFLDIRQKQITIASLRPGDTLEFVVTWNVNHPITPGHFWFEYEFTTGDIVLDERLDIDLPAGMDVILKVRAGSPQEQNGGQGRLEEGRRIYRWTTSNTARPSPDAKPIPYTGDGSDADVRLTSYRTWAEVGSWFSGLMSVPVAPEVKAKALELTRDIDDPSRRIEAIYDYVSREIRYVSLSFGLGRYAPHKPAQVLKNQYGDCKDKAALLSAMLAVIGVESLPVLLHSGRSLDESLASPLELDHVIAVIPEGDDPSQWIWMDATTEVAPIGMLTPQIRDRRVLLVGDGRRPTRLLRTPADPPFPSISTVEVKGRVNAIGVLDARVQLKLRGDDEFVTRMLLRMVPPNGVKEMVQNVVKGLGVTGEFSEETTSDANATRDPLELTTRVRMSGYLKWASRMSEMKTLPSAPIPYTDEDDRRDLTSLEFGSPSRTVLRAAIEVPPEYSLQPPVPVSTQAAGMAYVSRYSVEGNQLVIEREIAWGARKLEAAQFGDYSRFVRAIQSDFNQTVKVTGAVHAVPAIPPDATAKELYAAAYSAFEAKNYDAAVALWRRNTEVDPKMGDAWVSLGLAYSELKRYGEAAAAIQRQLELDRFDKRAHRDLGNIYKSAGKLDEAAKSYAKHLEINPLDGEALGNLGAIHNDLKQYSHAATALEKASTLGKLSAWGYTELAEAHLRLQQVEKANAATERALQMSPKPDIWARTAWLLADTGHDLERAAALATRTAEHAAAATQNLDAASIDADDFDLMERLAWSWNASAKIALRKGRLEEAERYAKAAWLLGRDAAMAFDLGLVYEKRNRLADALSFYLTAQALAAEPTAEMKAHVKRMVGEGADLGAMLESARRLALTGVVLSDKGYTGEAGYHVVIGPDRHAVDLAFLKGNEAIRTLEPELKKVEYLVEFPSQAAIRLALRLVVRCFPDRGCGALVGIPRDGAISESR